MAWEGKARNMHSKNKIVLNKYQLAKKKLQPISELFSSCGSSKCINFSQQTTIWFEIKMNSHFVLKSSNFKLLKVNDYFFCSDIDH